MQDKDRNLYYLHELSDYKVAEDYADVRDWEVIDADKRAIGKVDGLLSFIGESLPWPCV